MNEEKRKKFRCNEMHKKEEREKDDAEVQNAQNS